MNSKTYSQILADVIINWVKPLVDEGKLNLEDINKNLFGRMVKLYYEGRIDSRRMRRWIEERVGEKELESTLAKGGVSSDTFSYLDELEVQVLEK